MEKPNKEKDVQMIKEAKAQAQTQLDNFPMLHEIAIKGQVADKAGNQTKVLTVDLDKEGFIGLFLQFGNPFSMGAKGMEENSEKLVKYLEFMSNIDLTNSANHKEIGLAAISKARQAVSDFFTLTLVSGLALENVMVVE